MSFTAGYHGKVFIGRTGNGPDLETTIQTAEEVGAVTTLTATFWQMKTQRRVRSITGLGNVYSEFAPLPYVVNFAVRGLWDGKYGVTTSNAQWINRRVMVCRFYRNKSGGDYIYCDGHWLDLEFSVDVNGMILWQGRIRAQGAISWGAD